jgi:hypothetical protein
MNSKFILGLSSSILIFSYCAQAFAQKVDNLFPVFTQAEQLSERFNFTKSKFETYADYQRRMENARFNIGTFQVLLTPKEQYDYDANNHTLTIYFDNKIGHEKFSNNPYKYWSYADFVKSSNKSEVECPSGIGTTSRYSHEEESGELYAIVPTKPEEIQSSFKLKINPLQARDFVRDDESVITSDKFGRTSRLAFLVSFRIDAPYYEKHTQVSGSKCPKVTNETDRMVLDKIEETFLSSHDVHKLYVDVISIEVIDRLTGQVLDKKEY